MRILSLAISSLVSITALASSKKLDLTDSNSISIVGTVDGTNITPVIERIESMQDNEELFIFIDSNGGSVVDGLPLVELLNSTDKKITCVARKAISMAFSIFQACPTRLVTPYAILMQHRIAAGMQGTPEELNSRASVGKKLEDLLNKSDARRLKLSVDEFEKLVRYEFWLVGASDIINNKAADGEVLVKLPKKVK
jgi:ATP-dependent protease ClpP protease subunit